MFTQELYFNQEHTRSMLEKAEKQKQAWYEFMGAEGRSRADEWWLRLSLEEYKRHAYEHFAYFGCSEDAVEHDWPKIQFDEYDQWYDKYGKERLRENDKNNECKVEIAAIKALIRKRNRDE